MQPSAWSRLDTDSQSVDSMSAEIRSGSMMGMINMYDVIRC